MVFVAGVELHADRMSIDKRTTSQRDTNFRGLMLHPPLQDRLRYVMESENCIGNQRIFVFMLIIQRNCISLNVFFGSLLDQFNIASC